MSSAQELSELSINFLKDRPKSLRSGIGQFLTPRVLREALISRIELKPGMRILDPGVGTGEFLRSCLDIEPKILAEGWDIDPFALEVARKLVPEAELALQSALEQNVHGQFDLVIGNPPYFEMKGLNKKLKKKFEPVIYGRSNIFSFFFKVGLDALKDQGLLAYVVPPSMNNGAYFSKLRNYILDNAQIEFLRIYNDSKLFIDAQTAVQLIVLKKGAQARKHVIDLAALTGAPKKRIIFSEDPEVIEKGFQGKATLRNLGFEAITGTVVWNQHKESLRANKSPRSVPLIWSHNIGDNLSVVLDETKQKKPQYIEHKKPMFGPAIVVNRITGSVGSGTLRCALIPDGMAFLAENHVNVIRPGASIPPRISFETLIDLLTRPSVNSRVKLLTGNTQISATELMDYLPLDIPFDDNFVMTKQVPLF